MIGLKIKSLFILILVLLFSNNAYSQEEKHNSLGFSIGYTEALNYLQGVNYNFTFEREINRKFAYQLNVYWVSENNSSLNFNNGGPSFNLSDFANLEFGNKVLQDETLITGIETGIAYKLIDKNFWRLNLTSGLNFQKLISKTVETSVLPGQGDMTSFGGDYDTNCVSWFHYLRS